MSDQEAIGRAACMARFRFSVIGGLLAAPPAERGDVAAAIEILASRTWTHPITGEPKRYGFSTLESWYYAARNASNPLEVLRRKTRSDFGRHWAIPELLKPVIAGQHRLHRSWSYQLHDDNLAVRVEQAPSLGPMPSYATLARYMKSQGLVKTRRIRAPRDTEGFRRAQARLDEREVRSDETPYVDALWHTDFHTGSKPVLTPRGEWITPFLLAFLDDTSRLVCHAQWYTREAAQFVAHGLHQAILKRRLPRELMHDGGAPFMAAEIQEGLPRMAITAKPTLAYSPYQNGKQEHFWALVEGRCLPMLEGHRHLTLELLNRATQAWIEEEYNRRVHSELGMSPLERYLQGPDVGRDPSDTEDPRRAFGRQRSRAQRRGDGTVSIEGVRFEIPSRYRTLPRVTVRYVQWDLSRVHLVDLRTDTLLCPIYPLDRHAHADGQRRTLEPVAGVEPVPQDPAAREEAIAPLLSKLMADYAATGLPPAYLAEEETP